MRVAKEILDLHFSQRRQILNRIQQEPHKGQNLKLSLLGPVLHLPLIHLTRLVLFIKIEIEAASRISLSAPERVVRTDP